jgi:hypothetical protein
VIAEQPAVILVENITVAEIDAAVAAIGIRLA